jgi:uncharacterized membrane-anchored protein
MPPLADHPLRLALSGELHARPFPALDCPSQAAYLAIKRPQAAAARDREADRRHLAKLLERHGIKPPEPGATHWMGHVGTPLLKWECHTEFMTYTLFEPGLAEPAFDPSGFARFPEDWLAEAPGARMASALIRVEPLGETPDIRRKLGAWFVEESLAASSVVDGAAVVAGDFRIDPAGHTRFAVFVRDGTGPRRIGRIVQRLCEIETYKTVSMLGLARARALSPEIGRADQSLNHLVDDMAAGAARPDAVLKDLLAVSAALENLIAKSTFRFGATEAYEAIVNQRIAVLREERFDGRQSLAEFMTRRFDPSMRTVKSTERRLAALAVAAERAGELLRTQVDVERSAQNQKLLESMDRRADLQLRLQRTVEGLSVVAISYYAVGLIALLLAPLAEGLDVSKSLLTAAVTLPVVIAVWLLVRRIRKAME